MTHLGEFLALASGLSWAGASIFFKLSGQTVPPLSLNLFKNSLAFVLFCATMALAGQSFLPAGLDASDYALVLASGAIGIALSDTLYFTSLNALGASPAAVVAALYSPFTIALSLAFLGERLSLKQVLGVLLILAAVIIISYRKPDHTLSRKSLISGVGAGVLAQLATAVGIVILKPKLGGYPLLWVTNLRIAGGILFLLGFILIHPGRGPLVKPLARRANWKYMIPATALGTFISMLTWLAAMKYAQASVVVVLSQTSTVFIFILAILFLREKPTPIKALAVAMAAAGAFLAATP